MEEYRASTFFQPANLVAAIQAMQKGNFRGSRHMLGAGLSIPHHESARLMAVLGYDFIMIDAQHTAIDAENLVRLVQTINFGSQGRTCPIVRVPSASSHLLTYALDAGAGGIIFPHIDTPEHAEEAVAKCRYAYSGGERSVAPFALVPGITDIAPLGMSHLNVADRNVAVIAQIESQLAMDNLESIISTPGLNALMLGPGDLRVSLGLTPKQHNHPIFRSAVDGLIEVAKRHKKPLMTTSFKLEAGDPWLQDFQMLITGSDVLSVATGARTDLARTREVLSKGDDVVVVPADQNGMKNGNSHTNGQSNGQHIILPKSWEVAV